MPKQLATVAVALALGSCGVEPGEHEPAPTRDQPLARAVTRSSCEAANPCFLWRNGRCTFIGNQACAYLPTERMRGTWYAGFEESTFVPEPRSSAPRDEFGEIQSIWLELDQEQVLPSLGIRPYAQREPSEIAIEFVGRRSRFTGQFGHFGGWDHVIAVDRIISARLKSRHGADAANRRLATER